MQVGTNDLGHFLLTSLLWDEIKKADKGARIVNVASIGHMFADATPKTVEGVHLLPFSSFAVLSGRCACFSDTTLKPVESAQLLLFLCFRV